MQLACVPPPLAFNANMIGPVIANFGSEEQKKKFLPATANLDIWWCQGFSEPDAGSDLASLKTKAVRDGDDWVVNGQKTWTTLGQHADWIFALVPHRPRRPQEAAGHLDAGARWTPRGSTLRPIELIDGGFEVNEVFFENVRVPAESLIGEENQGWTHGQVPARQRACGRRPGRCHQAGPGHGQGDRRGDRPARGPAGRRRRSSSWRTSCSRSS